jgi:hypothetical protein
MVDLPRQIADLVKNRRRKRDGNEEVCIGIDDSLAATIIVTQSKARIAA